MSSESSRWLNTWILVGGTDWRGTAWHYRAQDQGEKSNHYNGFIPVEDVKQRLFNWEAVPLTPRFSETVPAGLVPTMPDGGVIRFVDSARQAMFRPPKVLGDDDKGEVFGYFGASSYQQHSYAEWLVDKVAYLLHGEIGITAAGLLKRGAIAFVEVGVPKSIETPEGVVFRPNILAGTSLDGSMSSTYKRTITNVVCDNTLSQALGEDSPTFKVRHSRHSDLKIANAAEALELIYSSSDTFSKQVSELCAKKLTDKQFDNFLNKYVEVPKDEGRGRTMALDKQLLLRRMWESDPRVAPWAGTHFGAVQLVNTWYHHEQPTRKGTDRAERNTLYSLYSDIDKLDTGTLALLPRDRATAKAAA